MVCFYNCTFELSSDIVLRLCTEKSTELSAADRDPSRSVAPNFLHAEIDCSNLDCLGWLPVHCCSGIAVTHRVLDCNIDALALSIFAKNPHRALNPPSQARLRHSSTPPQLEYTVARSIRSRLCSRG